MTTSEIDRLSRILTDMRVESSAQFARLDERLNAVPALIVRVGDNEKEIAAVKLQQQRAGRFTWSDVFKGVAALAAALAVYGAIVRTG